MKHSLWLLMAMTGLIASGFIMMLEQQHPRPFHPSSRRSPRDVPERWVDANLLQVQIDGRWQDVQLMPLADHLCQSGQPMFERYCNEPTSVAP